MPTDRFTTARLSIHSWRPLIKDRAARQTLEAALSRILTPGVLAYLPPALQIEQRGETLATWIDAREAESEVLLVEWKDSGAVVGLVILAPDPGAAPRPTIHVGYLIAEPAWGRGVASELLIGLVAAMENDGPVQLVAGVDRANAASARVLRKAGFVRAPDLSTPATDTYVRTTD